MDITELALDLMPTAFNMLRYDRKCEAARMGHDRAAPITDEQVIERAYTLAKKIMSRPQPTLGSGKGKPAAWPFPVEHAD
jgi:hypothetical protein